VIGLTQGTRLGMRAWTAESRIIAGSDQLDSTDRVLRQLITHLDTINDSGSGALSGTPTEFDFTTELPSAVSLTTRRADVKLALDAKHRLVLRWRLHRHEHLLGPPPDFAEAVLLDGVEKVDFLYRAPGGPEDGGWQDNWADEQPPLMVKIHLVFAKGDPRHWPDIVAAPLIVRQTG
jgi:general secretion pathway protein J